MTLSLLQKMQTIKGVGTTKNKKDGSITFDNITVDKAGTFKYTITETKGYGQNHYLQ